MVLAKFEALSIHLRALSDQIALKLCWTEHINTVFYLCSLCNIFKQRNVFALFSVNYKSKKAATIAKCVSRIILHITHNTDISSKLICVVVVFTYPHITPNTFAHFTCRGSIYTNYTLASPQQTSHSLLHKA
jgi:hypothetical protein